MTNSTYNSLYFLQRDKAEMKEKLNETIKEVELQKETYQQNETMMTELRDKILKLQEENLRLKDQVFANLSMFLSLYINIPTQAISNWVDAAESDFDSMFQVMSDMIGISEAIHEDDDGGSDDDSDTDTLTFVDDDRTECDVFLDELDDISEIAVDPS